MYFWEFQLRYLIWEIEAPKPVKKNVITSCITGTALSMISGVCVGVGVSHRYLNHPLYHGHCALIIFNPSHPAILSPRATRCTDQTSALTSHFNATEGQVPVPTNVLAPGHLFSMFYTAEETHGCYQASAELDNDPLIWIRCVGAGKHLKHKGKGSLRTGVEDLWQYVWWIVFAVYCLDFL